MVEKVVNMIEISYLWKTVFVNGVHLSLVLIFEFVVTVFDKAGILSESQKACHYISSRKHTVASPLSLSTSFKGL